MAGLGLELLGRRSSALGNSVWWQKSLCVWGLWLSTLDSKRFDLKLTMAHNQDRLQNSDSSVVYGHGHIIYSHTVKPMLWSSLDCCCCCSLTWATHHYDKPSNSQLWVWMALLKNTSQSICSSQSWEEEARKECTLLHWLFFEQGIFINLSQALNLMLQAAAQQQ